MYRSMVDIQSATAEMRRGKKEKKPPGKNIMACPITYDGHKISSNMMCMILYLEELKDKDSCLKIVFVFQKLS